MASLILLVVAAAWAAVLIPPLLRSRVENRPNSSVTDFRNQLSSLQRAMPARGVSMRGMARPLAQSPLARPAAGGRPVLRSGVRTHGSGTVRSPGQQAAVRQTDPARLPDVSVRRRAHEPGTRARQLARHDLSIGEAMKRRRANVLLVLVLVTACSLFLAVTTKTSAMAWLAVVAGLALGGYVLVLGRAGGAQPAAARASERRAPQPPQRAEARSVRDERQLEHDSPPRARRQAPPARSHRPAREHGRPAERRGDPERRSDRRYSHAV